MPPNPTLISIIVPIVIHLATGHIAIPVCNVELHAMPSPEHGVSNGLVAGSVTTSICSSKRMLVHPNGRSLIGRTWPWCWVGRSH